MRHSVDPREHATRRMHLAAAAGLFGVALAAIDGCVAMLAGDIPYNKETAWFLVQAAATFCFVAAGAFLVACFVAWAAARSVRTRLLPIAAGWGAGVILLDVQFLLADLSWPSAWTMHDVVLALVMTLLAGFVGLLTHAAATRSSRPVMAACAAIFTAYALVAFVFAWTQLFWITGVLNAASIVLTAVCGISVLAVPFLAARAPKGMLYGLTAVPLTLAAVAVGTLFLPENGRPERVTSDKRKISKVVLVTIDTLRADYLSVYNTQARKTPHLDRLASEGILFKNSYSLSSWTLPAVASFMTGLPPRYHSVNRTTRILDDSIVTLAEHLQSAGYRTAAIGQNPLIPFSNFAQGFDKFQFYPLPTPNPNSTATLLLAAMFPIRYKNEPSSTELTDLAIEWLRENRSGDFFLWLHYLDPHVPYHLPADRRPDDDLATKIIESSSNLAAEVRGGRVLSAKERSVVKDLYAREVQYVDHEVGRLTKVLEELGIYENSLIAVTSDHGEELWEHGDYEHGHALREELLRVPLFLKGPGVRPELREDRVGNYQLLPTILSLAGIENSDKWQSTTPSLLEPAAETGQTLFPGSNLYYADQNAVLWYRLKCVDTIDWGQRQLYDLDDVPVTDVEQLEACGQLLADHMGQADKAMAHYNLDHDNRQELDEATKKKLRSLGYIH